MLKKFSGVVEMNRLSRALRELADALESAEVERPASEQSWSLPSSPARSSVGAQGSGAVATAAPQPKAEGKAPKKGPTGSDVAYHSDHRCYVITVHPRGLVGFVEGPGATTWRRIEETLPNQRLAGSGARLRRVKDMEEAAVIWAKSHGSKPMPRPVLEA